MCGRRPWSGKFDGLAGLHAAVCGNRDHVRLLYVPPLAAGPVETQGDGHEVVAGLDDVRGGAGRRCRFRAAAEQTVQAAAARRARHGLRIRLRRTVDDERWLPDGRRLRGAGRFVGRQIRFLDGGRADGSGRLVALHL